MSRSFSSTTQISIFDIPHILDQICDDLSKDQLLACLDVSQAWRVLFTPQALRHVRFSNLKSHQTRTILHRASLIRSLTIDISDAGWFLNNTVVAVPPFNNLRELHCVDFNYQPKFKAVGPLYHTRPSIVDQAENSLLFIASSPKLHSLTVDNISRQYRSDHFTEDVLKSIYTHSSLAKIKICLSCASQVFLDVLFNSLPAGLRDFELYVMILISANADYHRAIGYPWQRKNQDGEETEFFTTPPLQQLERLVLGGPAELKAESSPLIIDQAIPISTDIEDIGYNPSTPTNIETVEALLQLLLDNCPDLETIELSGGSYFNADHHSGTLIQLQGSFAALREFRMSGSMTDTMYATISEMVIRSSATLEVAWINRWYWDWSAEEILNPFHINSTTSWTQCTRLKELGLYRHEGVLMTDPCWDVHPPFSVLEATKDYGTVFSQLEKLRIGVREVLWDVCPAGGYPQGGYDSWGEYDYEDDYYGNLDENDDEDWKPLKQARQTKQERVREHEKQRAERSHQRAFILQVRELFGRLKDLKQLTELDIEWVACPSICDMSLECALELFKETEVKDKSKVSQGGVCDNTLGTSKGWWGEVTREDLVWLCLPWAPQPLLQTSGVHPNLIKAAARQYENKSQLPGCCDDTNGLCAHEQSPWSTGDIYKARVGRSWKDWRDVTHNHHPYGVVPRKEISSYWYNIHDPHLNGDTSHVVNSHDFEMFVEGDAGNREEVLWGRKKATKGIGGRYRQKAIGKMNQRK
ncbi:hypothetical protein BGZ95_011519 [Linnemannia exigua]|uniref:F-box domain-containing protein n=1 Tax=Linnemannia exigua TaxID=604196 RepID=A0AAD4H573_9FUNG|nr:hypothetical protein BGZ95_011519 [Linnemannia exigua]